jgi:hypothetical protein
MTEQSETFAPLASSHDTLATYQNPFGFSLQVVQASEDINLVASGSDVAEVVTTYFVSAHVSSAQTLT